ncbi:hypothetical protein MMC18_008636 [Xylographa bjoerkii]|nr:hypothetical protein [Xylographa bjoerkii]
MNSTYAPITPAQSLQQQVLMYICSFNGTIGMKRLETMALNWLQYRTGGWVPLPTRQTAVQQAIEQYKQLRRSTPPQMMVAPPPAYQAPSYQQPPPQHTSLGSHHQQHQHAPAFPPGLSPLNSVASGNPPAPSQHQPAPQPLTPPTTPTTPDGGFPEFNRSAALKWLVKNSEPMQAPSRPVMSPEGPPGHMPARQPIGAMEFPWNPRVPKPTVYNPIGGPMGRPVPQPVIPMPPPVVRPEWATLNLGSGKIIWGRPVATSANGGSGAAQ